MGGLATVGNLVVDGGGFASSPPLVAVTAGVAAAAETVLLRTLTPRTTKKATSETPVINVLVANCPLIALRQPKNSIPMLPI